MCIIWQNITEIVDVVTLFVILYSLKWAHARVKAAEDRAKASLDGQHLARAEKTIEYLFSGSVEKSRAGIVMLKNLARCFKLRSDNASDIFRRDDLIQMLETAMLDKDNPKLWRHAIEAIPTLNKCGALGTFTLPKGKELTFTIKGGSGKDKAVLYGIDFTPTNITNAEVENCVLFDCKIRENSGIQFSECVAVLTNNDPKQKERLNDTEGIEIVNGTDSALRDHLDDETRILLTP